MKLVIDTAALWHRPLVDAIADAKAAQATTDGRLTVVLPAVAYAERVRQLRADGRDPAAWRAGIGEAGINIEAFGELQAERLAPEAADELAWLKHARDFLVAAHVDDDAWVVTPDKGPAWRTKRRMTPIQASEAIRDMLTR